MKTHVRFPTTSNASLTTAKSKKALLTCFLNWKLSPKASTLCSPIHPVLGMPWTLGSCCQQVLSFATNWKMRWNVEWGKPLLLITFLPRCCPTSLAAVFQAAQKKKLWATSKTLTSHSQEFLLLSKFKTRQSSQLRPSSVASATSWNLSNTGSMWWEIQSWSQSSISVVLQSEFFLAHPPLQVSEKQIRVLAVPMI